MCDEKVTCFARILALVQELVEVAGRGLLVGVNLGSSVGSQLEQMPPNLHIKLWQTASVQPRNTN
jgi:hypothetical protein